MDDIPSQVDKRCTAAARCPEAARLNPKFDSKSLDTRSPVNENSCTFTVIRLLQVKLQSRDMRKLIPLRHEVRPVAPCWTAILAIDNVLLSRTYKYVQTVGDVGGSRETENNVNICNFHTLRGSRVIDLLKSSEGMLWDDRDEPIQYSRPRLADTGDMGETVETLTDL
jgi:hypothetical protein